MAAGRRSFLAHTAAASAWLAGGRARAFAPVDDGGPDLTALRGLLGERLIAPGDTGYDRARKIRNRAFDGVRPRAVVMATNVEDVQHAVQWAAAEGVPIVPRCGGHSYVGASTTDGLVVSLLPMAHVKVDLDLTDWATAYYGSNLARLRKCKAMLDPSGVFAGRHILAP